MGEEGVEEGEAGEGELLQLPFAVCGHVEEGADFS